MQRIHFTTQDLANVRVAGRPWPMVEVIFGLRSLQGHKAGVLFDRWRGEVRATMTRLAGGREALHRLFDLVPRHGYIADFLAPLGGGGPDVEAWIDGVMATPDARRRADLEDYARLEHRAMRGWLSNLADGDRDSLAALEYALRTFFATAIEPQWAPVVAAFEAERAARARDLLDGGLGRLLGGLPGVARWDPPVLATGCPIEMDFHLDGRGLVLVPSFFCWEWPVILIDPELTPALVYPARHPTMWNGGWAQPRAPLAAALGRTRAAALELIAEGATTGELARRLRISPAAASWHVAALREAGLVATARNRYATHTLTTLGRQLVQSSGSRIQARSN
jgi:DNA-binding transcriptional ArsR family regulator